MSARPLATYVRMDEGTAEDYAIMGSYRDAHLQALPDRLLGMLVELGDKEDGSPIDGFAHSLQSATLAYDDGADDEMVFGALLHDIGQVASVHNHAEVAAAILKPFLSEKNVLGHKTPRNIPGLLLFRQSWLGQKRPRAIQGFTLLPRLRPFLRALRSGRISARLPHETADILRATGETHRQSGQQRTGRHLSRKTTMARRWRGTS